MNYIGLSIVLLAHFASSLKQKTVHCPAQCAKTVFEQPYGCVKTITKTETFTFTYVAPPQYHTSKPDVVTITETRWKHLTSEPQTYHTSSQPPQYGNSTASKITKSGIHVVPTYYSPSTYSSMVVSSTTCVDQCASAIATATEICSSPFTTTFYPATITTTLFATFIQNTTVLPVVSTETDVSTESFEEATAITIGTSTVETVVETETVTDATVTITSTTGTVTVTQQQQVTLEKRATSACTNSAQYSSACSCAGVTSTVVTMPAPTLTITSIINGTFTATQNLTATTSTTTSVTTTLISEVEATIPFPITTTIEATATAIEEVATTTTKNSPRPEATYIPCTGPPFNNGAGDGGCSSNCFCDVLAGSLTQGFCNTAFDCGPSCQTTADCPAGSACTSGHPSCGSGTCFDYTGCTRSAPPIMMFGREVSQLGGMREGAVVVERKREVLRR